MYVETLTGVLFWSSDLLGNIFVLFVFHLRPSPDYYYYYYRSLMFQDLSALCFHPSIIFTAMLRWMRCDASTELSNIRLPAEPVEHAAAQPRGPRLPPGSGAQSRVSPGSRARRSSWLSHMWRSRLPRKWGLHSDTIHRFIFRDQEAYVMIFVIVKDVHFVAEGDPIA